MATTTYTVSTVSTEGELVAVATKSKKATAIELARATRDETKLAVVVKTGAGNEVLALAAPKKIKMSPRFTRVVELPEGVVVPDGLRVAYVRARKNVALLHDPSAEDGEQYAFFDYAKGVMRSERFATTRDAGQGFKSIPVPEKVLPAPVA